MKAIFFCGDKSPYGRAHLFPLLKSKFNVTKVIIGTPERWEIFRQTLKGKEHFKERLKCNDRLKSFLKPLIPRRFLKKLNADAINIRTICNNRNVSLVEQFDCNDNKFHSEIKSEQYDIFFQRLIHRYFLLIY